MSLGSLAPRVIGYRGTAEDGWKWIEVVQPVIRPRSSPRWQVYGLVSVVLLVSVAGFSWAFSLGGLVSVLLLVSVAGFFWAFSLGGGGPATAAPPRQLQSGPGPAPNHTPAQGPIHSAAGGFGNLNPEDSN